MRPVVQLAAAFVVMLVGAWLVGWWAVGLVLIVAGVVIAADAVLRESSDKSERLALHDQVLERWRRAR